MTHREQTRFGDTESEAGSEQTSVALNDAHQGHHHSPRCSYQSKPVTRATELLHDLIIARNPTVSGLPQPERIMSPYQVRRDFAQAVRDEEATQSRLREMRQLRGAIGSRKENLR